MELKRWIYTNEENRGSRSFLDSLLALKNIGEEDRAEFIHPVFYREQSLAFAEMAKAADLIKRWMRENKRILIFGDYDVDGICATTILKKAFTYLDYRNVLFHIPSRFDEGYGINMKSIEAMMPKAPEAIISVDCGINQNEGIGYLKEQKIEIIITDHHSIPEELPPADLILDPKLSSPEQPYYDLCGAGVAFYLALHLLPEEVDASELLQFACIATIADLVPLTRDNRRIVASGISAIRDRISLPLKILFKTLGVSEKKLKASDLAFQVAPCINASGRLKHAYEALKLFLAEELSEMEVQAKCLAELNVERKNKQSKVIEDATRMIEKDKAQLSFGVIMLYSDDWHEGVIGIAASRLVELYHRPAIVFSLKDGILKGSARSIGDFSIYDAIHSASELLLSFGGHRSACGLSLRLEDFDRFRSLVKGFATDHLKESDVEAVQAVDLSLEAPEISRENLKILDRFEPYGMENPRPVFVVRDMTVSSSFLIGKKKEHLKFVLNKDENSFDAIKFGLKHPQNLNAGYRMDLAFSLEENSYGNRNNIQLMAKNLRSFDPSVKGLPSMVFSLYAKELISRIEESEGALNFKAYARLRKIAAFDLIARVERKDPVVIVNYESLLSAVYSLFDHGYPLKKLLDLDYLKGIIEILPLRLTENSVLYGHDYFYAPSLEGGQNNYRTYVAMQLKHSRYYFEKIYLYLKKMEEVDSLRLIHSSLYPLRTATALEFFKEAKFVEQSGRNVRFSKGVHETYHYETSNIKQGIDKFYSIL